MSGKLCLTCEPRNLLHSHSVKTATWLTRLGRDTALPPNIPRATYCKRERTPTIYSVEITVKVGPPSLDKVKVFFWAAMPRSIEDRERGIYDAPTAYGAYKNSGVAYIRKGVLRLKLACPQPYQEEGHVWPPHFHYVKEDGRSQDWQTTVYTAAAFPGSHGMGRDGRHKYVMKCLKPSSRMCTILTPARLRSKWDKVYIVNALPLGAPGITAPRGKSNRKHLHLPSDADDKEVRKVCRRIRQKPYVVYCQHPRCHAASDLILRMLRLGGCMNVYYLPSGVEGW